VLDRALLILLEELKQQNHMIIVMVQQLLTRATAQDDSYLDTLPANIKLPVSSMDELAQLEQELNDNQELKTRLVCTVK
jgi:hypothetical protein